LFEAPGPNITQFRFVNFVNKKPSCR